MSDTRARPLSDELDDAERFSRAARAVAVPRAIQIDSFRLHAPLELLARYGLLPHVSPNRRGEAMETLDRIAGVFLTSSPPVATVGHHATNTPVDGSELCGAIRSGKVGRADEFMQRVAIGSTAEELVGVLADLVVGRLAGAAHGAIFLYLLPRTVPRSQDAALLGRGLIRELAAAPTSRLHWVDHRRARSTGAGFLAAALTSPPSAGSLDTTFIAPTMSLIDDSGLARELLDGPTRGLPVPEARRVLLRIAAHSMLQDDPAHAPYGWTHCLTLAQATLGIAGRCVDPERAVAVAATYVLGFRSTLSSTAIDLDWRPVDPGPVDPDPTTSRTPDVAAAQLWHADDGDRRHHLRQVIDTAATHHDAHLAKYTLACLDAARDDPDAAPLFHAAAAYLAAWWTQGSDGA